MVSSTSMKVVPMVNESADGDHSVGHVTTQKERKGMTKLCCDVDATNNKCCHTI